MTKARLKQIIREELQVVLTNEEAGEMFGDEVQEELEQQDEQLDESIDVETIQNLEAAIGAAYQEMTTPTDIDQTYAGSGEPVSKDPQDMHDKAVEFLVDVVKDVTSGEMLGSPRTINEDGHTDVPSAARKMKLAIEDAGQILQGLQAVDGELPAWWMSKITIASEYLNKARDYLLTPSQEMQEVKLSEPEKEEKEKIVKGMKKSKADFKKRYGKDAESVMYATATKIAKEKK